MNTWPFRNYWKKKNNSISMRLPFVLAFLLLSTLVFSQSTHDILVSGGLDIFKTDNRNVFDKAQIGLEMNYFVVRHFSVGGGAEVWTGNSNSFVLGMRWYADQNFFARLRGLIGANDVSLGVGWSKPLDTHWRLEVLGDYYFKGDFGLRAGVGFLIR
jgi:hypothetical protein